VLKLLQVNEDALTCLAAACLHTTVSSATLQSPVPSLDQICAAVGCSSSSSSSEAAELQQQLQQALKSDTSAISVSRCSIM
jgi:hypothetical protein